MAKQSTERPTKSNVPVRKSQRKKLQLPVRKVSSTNEKTTTQMGIRFPKQPLIQTRMRKIVQEVIDEYNKQVRDDNGRLPKTQRQIVDEYYAIGNSWLTIEQVKQRKKKY